MPDVNMNPLTFPIEGVQVELRVKRKAAFKTCLLPVDLRLVAQDSTLERRESYRFEFLVTNQKDLQRLKIISASRR